MVVVLSPLGAIIHSKVFVNKEGRRFVRDPESGKYWSLDHCRIVTSTDQTQSQMAQTPYPWHGIPPYEWDF